MQRQVVTPGTKSPAISRFGMHPLVERIPNYHRKELSDWLSMLASREKLNSSFAAWCGNHQIRKTVREAFIDFILDPSSKKLRPFLESSRDQWRVGLDLTDDAKGSMVRIMGESAEKFSHVVLMREILRDNGLAFVDARITASDPNRTILSDILYSAKLSRCRAAEAYIIDGDNPFIVGDHAGLPGGWANHEGFFVVGSTAKLGFSGDRLGYGCAAISTAQHEAQHVLDRRAELDFENPEYTAILAPIVFSAPWITVRKMSNAIFFGQPHQDALLRIKGELCGSLGLKSFDDIYFLPEESVIKAARGLLNREYAAKTGFTYDEIIEPFLPEPKGQAGQYQ